jgi:hypothetical protein
MNQNFSVDDVYAALKEVIPQLESVGKSKLAAVLTHRLYRVPWTTGHELLEELQRVLSDALASDARDVPKTLYDQLRRILVTIEDYLSTLEDN